MTRKPLARVRSPARRPTRALLDRLLAARNEHPENLEAIDREIHAAFAETRAILVLDMCGFSRLTMQHGITHFLAMIHRLHGLVRPLVHEHGGRVVKTEADNVFATFDDAPEAVAAARAIQSRLDQANVFLPEDWDLHASLGIGYGPTLLVGQTDLFGNEVNIASKLGEDIAGRGETFLTEAARGRLPVDLPVERREIQVSALVVNAFKLLA
ncbi:MAG TPA: adenylate/guanylate cyclase domain-containing protein [Polyangia bacterium]|nr:adenylate/guanylate cyclase domain-containing protein [Polyangia bacterium]